MKASLPPGQMWLCVCVCVCLPEREVHRFSFMLVIVSCVYVHSCEDGLLPTGTWSSSAVLCCHFFLCLLMK